MKRASSIISLGLASTLLFSCASLTKTQKGAIIGTTGGAAAGAVIGRAAGNTALGAIIGAAVGGTAGVLIGRRMDKQAAEIKAAVPNAQVQRKGEGILVTFSSNVLFGFDQSTLNSQSESTIQDLNSILTKYPDENVLIIGYTDNIGRPGYNLRLSQRRADAVSNYLVQLGVDQSRITTKGMGMADPKYPNDTDAHRAENRRVEFVITANDKMKQQAIKDAANGQ
ncbi:MAG: OmpA family protein [Chitinophagaceae bacterium]